MPNVIANTNTLALLAIMDWPEGDAETVIDQIQHFVRYVHGHPDDWGAADYVSLLCSRHEKANYDFAVALYKRIGLPDGMSADE